MSHGPTARYGQQPLPPYVYAPLKDDADIRLLHLLPGSFENQIELRIVHVALSKPTETAISRTAVEETLPSGWEAHRTPEGRWFYWHASLEKTITYQHPDGQQYNQIRSQTTTDFEALSYAWGDAAKTSHALILPESQDGDPSKKSVIHITHNLDVALRHLRSNETTRILWVDAVSINQDDDIERGAQVMRMHDIFAQAHRVVAWLGPTLATTETAFNILKYLGMQIEISDDNAGFAAPDTTEPTWSSLQKELPYSPQEWSAVLELLQMPWMQRLWVLQEIVAAADGAIFQCGHLQLSWFHLRRAIPLLAGRRAVPFMVSHALSDKILLAFNLRTTPLQELIYLPRRHLCADPRDKVYGIFSFFGPCLRNRLVPSYETSFEKVYESVFLASLEVTRRLDLLSQCFFDSEKSDETLPSWIPDWRSFPNDFCSPGWEWQAAGLSRAFARNEGAELQVTGLFCGRVSSTFGVASPGVQALVMKLRELQPTDLHDREYFTGESLVDAWARCLVTNKLRPRYPDVAYITFKEWKTILLAVIDPDNILYLLVEQYIETMGNVYRDTWTEMSFIHTTEGHIGFGPSAVKEGDRVCVLLGLSTPMIVRPAQGNTFRVIGWCYIHGLMDGEALLGQLPPSWSMRYNYVKRRFKVRYHNQETKVVTLDDPRLGPLPSEWQRIDTETTADDPICFDHFKNTETGEVINYDPRMTPEMLAHRGVQLETIRLV